MKTPKDNQKNTSDKCILAHLSLNQTEKEIIAQLQEDGRRSFVTIARNIGVTEKTVRTHTKRLLEKNIIQIVALTTPAALGYPVAAMAAISIASSTFGTEILDKLAQIDTIDYVVLTYGRYAIFVEIIARDMKELQSTIETKIGTIPGITDVEIFPLFSVYYQQARIPGSSKVPNSEANGVRDRELSDVDKAIAAELNLNGREPFGTIAEKLDISEAQVRQRVQQMLSVRQINIMAIINPLKLLNRSMAWIAIKAKANQPLSELAESIAEAPHISYIAICAGRFDIFAEIICSSETEIMTAIDSHIRPINGISSIETFIYVNLHSKSLIPLQYRDSKK